MKTTIEIPDHILREAKALAATRGITLKQLLSEAMEEKLRVEAQKRVASWKDLHGDLKSLRRETARVQSAIDEEFGRIDDEDVA